MIAERNSFSHKAKFFQQSLEKDLPITATMQEFRHPLGTTTGQCEIGTGWESMARCQGHTGSLKTGTVTMEQHEIGTGDQEISIEWEEVTELDKTARSMCGWTADRWIDMSRVEGCRNLEGFCVDEAFLLLFWCVKTVQKFELTHLTTLKCYFINYWTFEKAVVRLEEFRFALWLKRTLNDVLNLNYYQSLMPDEILYTRELLYVAVVLFKSLF